MLAALVVVVVSLVSRHARPDPDPIAGSITIDVTDAAKKGVAGITITAGGISATTGSEQPTDTELAAAARQGGKALDTLNAQYNARASITGLPLGNTTITLDAKGAKPITIAITADKPTWKLTATVDGKSKKIIGKPKVVFDEVANARAQAAQAKAEVAKAKAAQDAAKAEQDRARAAQEQARADQERAKANAAKSDADAQRARDAAEAERLKRARSEAPSKVSVAAPFCSCADGHQIKVHCAVTNNAEVPVVVSLDIFAEGGTFGVNANGKGSTQPIAAKTVAQFDFMAALGTNLNCKSCKSQRCTVTSVVAQ